MSTRQYTGLFVVAFGLLVATGCSEGKLGERPDGGGQTPGDTGTVNSDDTDDRDEETGVEVDAGSDGGDERQRPAVQSFTSCGSGGISNGSDLRAIQCYGPAETSDNEATGENVRWQPGAFRVVTDE